MEAGGERGNSKTPAAAARVVAEKKPRTRVLITHGSHWSGLSNWQPRGLNLCPKSDKKRILNWVSFLLRSPNHEAIRYSDVVFPLSLLLELFHFASTIPEKNDSLG